MKTNNYLIVLFIVILVSCEKSNLLDQDSQFLTYSNISELLINPENKDETNFNMVLLQIAESYEQIFENTEFKSQIFRAAKISDANEVDFSTLEKENNQFASIYNKSLKSSYFINIEKLSLNLKYNNVQYDPVVYIPNIKIADSTLNPVIAVGVEVATENGNDIIPGWYYNNKEGKINILINEEFAMNSKRPICIINGVNKTDSSNEILDKKNLKSSKAVVSNPITKIDNYSIAYRYDKSKRSEYSYKLVYVYEDGTFDEGGYREEIREIHKDDIGKTFTNDYEIWQVQYWSMKGLYFVTFEYDWYTSKKTVYWDDGFGYKVARMSKTDEWYQKCYFDLTPNYNFTIYSKGHIKIKME